MFPKVFEDVSLRLENKKVTALTREDWVKITGFTYQVMQSNKALTNLMIELMTHRLGIDYDSFRLDRIPQTFMDLDGNLNKANPLVLTLYLEKKVTLIIDGGTEGDDVFDMVTIFDKLLNMNVATGEEHVPIEYTVSASEESFKC